MKHCPACNFSFPDSRYVCDFDGTALVNDPERPPIAKAPTRPSRFHRISRSPTLLATLAMLTLFLSALLIGYFNSSDIPPVVKDESARPSLTVAQASKEDSVESPAPIKMPAKRARIRNSVSRLASARLPRQANAARTLARHKSTSPGNVDRKSESAGLRAERQTSEKQPRLIAFMKTTWNVLKKPFRF